MLFLLLKLWDLLEDARLRRAARRYQSRLKVINSLAIPEDFKKAAKEKALNKVGEELEHYTESP